MWAVGRRSDAGPLRLMTKGGCREARPRMGTRSLPVINASSRFLCASVKPWTASQNHTITCTARQTEAVSITPCAGMQAYSARVCGAPTIIDHHLLPQPWCKVDCEQLLKEDFAVCSDQSIVTHAFLKCTGAS